METYVLLTWDMDRLCAYFVGRRSSLEDVLADVDLYARDPLFAGKPFAVHVRGDDNHVTWSDDWDRVMDLAYRSRQATVKDLGPGTYGAIDICLPDSLVSLEAARAAA